MGEEMEARLKRFLLKVQDDPEILAVFLFGSAARGEQGPASDVDVCLVFVPAVRDRIYICLLYTSPSPRD